MLEAKITIYGITAKKIFPPRETPPAARAWRASGFAGIMPRAALGLHRGASALERIRLLLSDSLPATGFPMVIGRTKGFLSDMLSRVHAGLWWRHVPECSPKPDCLLFASDCEGICCYCVLS